MSDDPDSEEVSLAVFALAQRVPLLQYTGRRILMWTEVPAKPGLCQGDFDEEVQHRPNADPIRSLGIEWWLYHDVGLDTAAVPTIFTHELLAQVKAALAPAPYQQSRRNTLNGLVHDCFISGTITKVSGDLDGQALITVPIRVIIP